MKALRHCWIMLMMIAGAAFIPSCLAHETRPAYLEIKETSPRSLRRCVAHSGERRHAFADRTATARGRKKRHCADYARAHRFAT